MKQYKPTHLAEVGANEGDYLWYETRPCTSSNLLPLPGVHITMYPEKGKHSRNRILEAKEWIRRRHDVVAIDVIKVDDWTFTRHEGKLVTTLIKL